MERDGHETTEENKKLLLRRFNLNRIRRARFFKSNEITKENANDNDKVLSTEMTNRSRHKDIAIEINQERQNSNPIEENVFEENISTGQ
jgi:hypothetical protein